ncbi:hypothetical protein ILYODFUR_031688 [Ilyodon furcidens]|uniref:Uncharacterized protein n=1 Tax=Ilyodon furcidens TaxID=33524 RepID=A0ABV0UA27_9TELE
MGGPVTGSVMGKEVPLDSEDDQPLCPRPRAPWAAVDKNCRLGTQDTGPLQKRAEGRLVKRRALCRRRMAEGDLSISDNIHTLLNIRFKCHGGWVGCVLGQR